jgi:hypothetical protein
MHDAGDIARMLRGRIRDLVAELLPAGKVEGAEYRAGSLAGEPGRSLGVHLVGARAGIWSDFSSGERGDALDLVACVLYGGDKRQALAWARRWLGLGEPGGVAPVVRRALPPVRASGEVDAETQQRRAAALRMFLSAEPRLAGTPGALYLARRGIDLAQLGRQPRALRFHPQLMNVESGRAWPAIVAAISDSKGGHVATHRTWLSQDASGQWGKAPLQNPKMSLGSFAGGAIRLWRGASARPLAQAADGEAVCIGEGIETSLSIVLSCPELRTLCAVSLANMARVELPPAIGTVVLCADNDPGNEDADRALQRAIDRFCTEGRQVRVARPPAEFGDFNDMLKGAQ